MSGTSCSALNSAFCILNSGPGEGFGKESGQGPIGCIFYLLLL